MLRKILTENFEVDPASLVQNIYHSLETIQQQLQEEIINKQAIIDRCAAETKSLRAQLDHKDETIQKLEAIIAENQRSIEGNRQLINKLLNDLDRMQQNVEWYKRTYEHRSFWGTVKEKISGKLK
jgi:peptidoglycan hydrolase CwlO-like protein